MAQKGERTAFKDYWDRDAAKHMAAQIVAVHPSFDQAAFVRRAARKLGELEMMDRVRQFSDALAAELPDDIPAALEIITRSLPPALPDCENVTEGWRQWPIGQFIADHATGHLDAAFPAMTELTQRFSSEFAVRPFVVNHQEEVFRRLLKLTGHKNPHVRRWCSEGVRPRLPWGGNIKALIADPSPIFPILDALKDDPERYVTRSVANSLNDIAKDHPERVVDCCRAWANESATDPAERSYVLRHALRSLVKDGHPGALAVLGFGPPKQLQAALGVSPSKIKIGDSVELQAALKTTHGRAQSFVVDYAVHYVRKTQRTSGTTAKVFKWKTFDLPAKGSISLRKKHAMKRTTIRALYPGVHRVTLQINGVDLAEAAFELVES